MTMRFHMLRSPTIVYGCSKTCMEHTFDVTLEMIMDLQPAVEAFLVERASQENGDCVPTFQGCYVSYTFPGESESLYSMVSSILAYKCCAFFWLGE